MYQVIAWVVLLIAFAVLEGITATLVSIWFCLGALAALIAASVNASIWVQVIVFAIVSLACMAVIRPLTKKYWLKSATKTNADRIIDAQGVVVETVDNLQATGQVRVLGEYWTARSEGAEVIPEGALVRILRIEGVKAIIEKNEKG